MKRNFLVFPVMLIIVMSTTIVMAQTPTPQPLPAAKFSLWYTSDMHTSNGTVFSTNVKDCLAVVDVRYASGGIYPTGTGGRIFILRNDGTIPINVSVSSINVNMPSDLAFNFVWGNYYGSTTSAIQPGQSITLYFIAEALAGGYYNNQGQWIINYTSDAPFSYSYDTVVTATPQANGTASQQIINVEGSTKYPSNYGGIVANGGFEYGVSPWQVITSGAPYAGTILTTGDAHFGSSSGLFTVITNPNTGGYVALSQSTLGIGVGQTYDLTFYYKSTLSSCNAFIFCKDAQAIDGHDLAFWASSNLPAANTWTQVTMTFGPIPVGTTDVQLHYNAPNGVLGNLQIDDVFIKESNHPAPTASPTPSSTPAPTPTPASSTTPAPVSPTPTTPSSSPTPMASVNPTPTTSSTPTPTLAPNVTPITSQAATSSPTLNENPTPTSNPNTTSNPSATDSSTSSSTVTPSVPEASPIAFVIILFASLVLAITIREIIRKVNNPLITKESALG